MVRRAWPQGEESSPRTGSLRRANQRRRLHWGVAKR